MIKKVLIANRGEIAVRIIKTCKMMGIKTVAVYSKCDKDSYHIFLADETYCIGDNESKDSYLNMDNIINVAINYNCDAIHPGYGFLSENYEFAKKVEDNNIVFIGASSKILKKVQDKYKVKKEIEKLNIPVIKDWNINSINDIKNSDYPVMLKSNFGGGGKGLKVINNIDEYKNNYKIYKEESKIAFSKSDIYIEKYIKGYKHIEIQVISDKCGNITILPERDCSYQLNYQKVVEESPSSIGNKLLKKLKEDSIKIFKHFKYDNIGTIEFLLDENYNYYFLEINARLQVEHTITEEVTGIDLVKSQILISSGYKNTLGKEIKPTGHAIEARINAVDTNNNFYPSIGHINIINVPSGANIRLETYMYQNYLLKPYYDSLIYKLIVYDKKRDIAINKILLALDEFIIGGIKTNIDFLYKIINKDKYRKGTYSLNDLEEK